MNSRYDEEEIDSMARSRRRANARNRLNLEIVGIAAFALAVLCGIALAFPQHAGTIGGWTAADCADSLEARRRFSRCSWRFSAAIIFLEVNVPRMIAGLGSTALAYFLMIDAMFGAGGSAATAASSASNIWWALARARRHVGRRIVLSLALLSLTLWLTK